MRRKSVTSEMMKDFIVDSLLLLMEKKGFQEITVMDIVSEAGVNRSTYYRHFNRKEDVILHFLDNISRRIHLQEKENEYDIENYLVNMYAQYYKFKQQMLTIYKSGLSILFLDVLKKYLGAEGHKEKQISFQYDIAFHIGGTFNMFVLWFSRDMSDTPEEMARYTLAALPQNYLHHIWGKKK